MRKIRELLRLQAEGVRVRPLADRLRLPKSTVADYLERIRAADLTWPQADELDDAMLVERLFGTDAGRRARRPVPDWATVHAERKRKGVTLQLLWLEYKVTHPDGYQYTQFCERYKQWCAALDPVLRQPYAAGEKVFVDYAGQTMPVVDTTTGEVRDAQIFVGTLGASNYIYAEATWTQQLPDWIAAQERMLRDFGGVPALIVPDNLKSGVHHASYYDPDLNPTYQDFAAHYGTAVLPARVARPRDKAKVETGVQLIERWCLAPLRNHTFFALGELNRALRGQLDALNARPFQKFPGTRTDLLATLERPALQPLPATPFEFAEWKKARVNIDYHIQVDRHLYSVPYPLVRHEVDVRLTATTVEVLHQGKRVAAHRRDRRPGAFTTDPGHRPKAHQQHLEWTPSRLIRWGQSIGTATGELVDTILNSKPHPEHGYRACLGLLSLARRYSGERLDAACARALRSGTPQYRSVKSMLEHSLDRLPLEDEPLPLLLPSTHAHVRGPAYYTTPE